MFTVFYFYSSFLSFSLSLVITHKILTFDCSIKSFTASVCFENWECRYNDLNAALMKFIVYLNFSYLGSVLLPTSSFFTVWYFHFLICFDFNYYSFNVCVMHICECSCQIFDSCVIRCIRGIQFIRNGSILYVLWFWMEKTQKFIFWIFLCVKRNQNGEMLIDGAANMIERSCSILFSVPTIRMVRPLCQPLAATARKSFPWSILCCTVRMCWWIFDIPSSSSRPTVMNDINNNKQT